MNNFKLNDSSNKNKVFLVKRSEIEGRLDPNFYTDLYRENEIRVMNSPFVTKSLSDITTTISDGTHFTPQYQSTGIKFISVKDVRKSALDLNHPVYISVEEAEKLDKRCKPQKNDILLTKIGATYGYAAVIDSDERFQIFVSLALIRPNNKLVNPHYLEICLNSNFAYLQFQRNLKGAGVPDLHLEEIRKLKLPVPSLDIQNEIVEKYSYALKKSREKQSQSKTLLKSIDSYLLNELGIELPKNDNSLKARIFTTKFSAVCGGRLDPKRYCTSVEKLKNSFENSKYETHKLFEFITESTAGDWGIDEDEISEKYEKCLVIRATEFDNDYNLNIENTRVKYRQILISKLKKMNIKKDDLLIEKSGGSEDQSVGRVAIITNEIMKNKIAYSNFIHKISLSNIYPEYLFCYLKTAHNIKLIDTMQSQTNGIRNLIMQEYFNQTIPLPPLSKQIEITEHIKEIRSQAKQLEIESEQILLDAKKEIEKMILGE